MVTPCRREEAINMMKQVRHRFTVLAIAGAATVAMLPALAGQLAHGSDRLDGRQVQATRVGRWIHTGPNLTPPVQALGVDPSRPSTLYAGSDGAGRQHTSPRTEVIPGCLQRGASP